MSSSIVSQLLGRSADLKAAMADDSDLTGAIAAAAQALIGVARSGGTIYTCGNGGSACDAMHFAEELVARYRRPRPGIRARHLLDAGILTCWSNDEDFQSAFARQVETLCGPQDALTVFSTSGNSENIVRAAQAARSREALTIGLLGKGGGRLATMCDHVLVVPSDATERIQEAHIAIVHIFCELIERDLLGVEEA